MKLSVTLPLEKGHPIDHGAFNVQKDTLKSTKGFFIDI